MQETAQIQIINDKQVSVSEILLSFQIKEKPSSNIAFFGICSKTNRLFVQFKNGSSYIYREVPVELMQEMDKAQSVGRFFSQHIAGKFEQTKYNARLVQIEAVLD